MGVCFVFLVLGFSPLLGLGCYSKKWIAPFRAKVFGRLCWVPSGVLSQLSTPPSSQRISQGASTHLHLPVWCDCENPPVRCSSTFHLCLEYGHAGCALSCDPSEMTSFYCALINQCVCFLSFTLCLFTFTRYPIILNWVFFSLHQNTSNFFLLLNMSILFSNTLELYISHRAHDFSADCKTEPCYPTCSSPVFSPAPGISISLIFTPTSHPAFGIWLLSS